MSKRTPCPCGGPPHVFDCSRYVETPEYAAMLLRLVRRYAERLEDADYPDLSDAVRIHDELDAAIRAGCRAQADRTSWAQVGLGLGMSRQGAWRKYGPR